VFGDVKEGVGPRRENGVRFNGKTIRLAFNRGKGRSSRGVG